MAERKRKDDEPSSPASNVAPQLATFGGAGAAVALSRKGIEGPLKAIRKGEEMRRAGAKPEAIHAETSKMLKGTPYAGVTYGADMKPRFEIDDSGAKMKFAAIPAGREAFMKDVLDHPALYEAYPSLKHMTVRKNAGPGSQVLGNDVSLSNTVFQGSKPIAGRDVLNLKARGHLIHELQHPVQDLEGHAPGGTPSDFARKYPNNPDRQKLAYRLLAGEQEAEMSRERQHLSADGRRARMPEPEVPYPAQIVNPPGQGARAKVDMTSLSDAASAAWNALVNKDMADNKPVRFRKLDPRKITADPATFQFKSGGDSHGVTDRLKGVTKWDPVAAGKAVVFERANGELVIADGHQRRGLATRLADEGQHVRMDAYVLRERDGWSPRDVYAYAAMKNIKESSGNAVDMAKVMRERPDMLNGSVPMSDAKVREARSLSKLSNDAFGMVVNGMVKPEHAAAVGEAVTDTTRHLSMLKEMSEAGLQSASQAKLYVGQALAAPQYTETTGSLFGEETQTRSLLAERTKVLDKALSALRNDKRIFGLLEREASNIESAGNRLSHEANAARATDAGQLSTLVEKLATTRGPVSDMLDRAARDLADGKTPSAAARTFVRSVGDTMKQGGIAALTGEAAPMKVPVDPNQSHMFGEGGERPGWSDQAREASATKRKGKAAMSRAKSMMDSDLPPRKKITTTPEAEAKWNKILQSIPQDDAEKRLRDRKAGERVGKNGSRPRAMADDDMFGGPSTKDKLSAKARQMEAKGRTGDPLNTGLFGSSKDQTDLVDMAKQKSGSLTARIGRKTVSVQSLEQVSQAYRKTISAANTGASKTPPLRLYDSAGNVVAHVSYNGKVWSGDVGSWKSGDQPLYEPGKAQIRDKPAVTKQSIMAEHKKGMARIEGKDARAAEIAKFTKMNGGRPQGSWSTRDLAANNRATIKERGGEMTYNEWLDKKAASDAKLTAATPPKPHAITTKPPRDTPSRTGKKAADMAKIKGELHEIFARDSHGKQRNTKGELLPERKTGKKGTQNAANLEAINANRKANAKGKPAKPLMKDAEVKHLLKQGLVTREDVKSSPSMADLKAKARQSATNMLRDRGMAMDDKRSVYQTIDEWVNSGKPLDAKPTKSRIGKTWTDGNGVTHTWTAESESAHQEWLARHSIGSSAETAGIKDPAAQMKDVFGPKMQPGTIPQMTPEGQAARYINRQRTSGSTKTDAELVAEFNAAPRTDFKSKAKSKFGKGMAVLAPLAIGAAALAAANDAKAEGLDEMGQVKAAGKAGAESTGALVAFTGATSLATAALVKGGMTLARATPIMQGVLMAGGAIHGALAAKPGERLIGALKGAWDMSLPGMVVNTGRDVAGAVSDRAALARTPQFDKANAAYEASHLATHTESPDASSDPNKKKGWSNSARISAYIARNPGGTALPYGGDRGKTSADAKKPAASTR